MSEKKVKDYGERLIALMVIKGNYNRTVLIFLDLIVLCPIKLSFCPSFHVFYLKFKWINCLHILVLMVLTLSVTHLT